MLVEVKNLEEIENTNKELFENIIEENRFIEVDDPYWSEYTLESFNDIILSDIGLIGDNLRYDLYYNTASLDYKVEDIDLFIKEMISHENYNYYLGLCIEIIRIDQPTYYGYDELLEKHCYINHSRDEIKEIARDSLTDSIMLCIENKIDYIDFEIYAVLAETLETEIEKIKEDLNNQILDHLKGDYEYYTSNDCIKETLLNLELLYDKKGSIVDPF